MNDDQLVFFMGRPGAGKSTIAKAYADITGADYISTGDVARRESKVDIVVNDALEAGDMAPREWMDGMMRSEMFNAEGLTVFDGYPRYWQQLADILMYKMLFFVRVYFVNVECHCKTAMDRCARRGRADNDIERVETYLRDTRPTIDWVMKRDLVCLIMNEESTRIEDHVARLETYIK